MRCSGSLIRKTDASEQFRIKGTSVVLNLAKNPAGFNQNISAVMQDGSPKDIIIVINDKCTGWKRYLLALGMWILIFSEGTISIPSQSVVSGVRICASV